MVVNIEKLFHDIAIGLIFTLISSKFIISFKFYNDYKNQELEYKNEMLLGTSLGFIFLAFGRIVYVIFDFFLTEFDSFLYQQFSTVWKIASIIQYIGIVILVFYSEKVIFSGKTKYLITIISIISIMISMFQLNFLMVQLWSGISTLFATLFIPLSYLYLVLKSSGKIRKKAFAIFLGFILYLIGFLLLGEVFVTIIANFILENEIIVRYLMHIISVIIRYFGIWLFIYGYRSIWKTE
ncbi:MAG: hypothetical protein GF329_02630 [Candidatus Lokiarchaeota archaeon]|nr:hypothetical protein [Candidatus Lokiarchaeota archaeon]